VKLAVLVLAAMGPLAGGASAAQTRSSTCSNVSASLGAGGNGMTGGVFRSKSDDLRRYWSSLEALRAVALGPAESTEFINGVMREYA